MRHWIEQDHPPEEWQFAVLEWLFYALDNPYYRATPATQLDNRAWFARIPHAEDDESATVCLYTVDPVEYVVRCSGFTTLRKPI